MQDNKTCHNTAKDILNKKADDLHKLAKALLEYETLSGDEIRDLILRDIYPSRNQKIDNDKSPKQESALGSIGLKPKLQN